MRLVLPLLAVPMAGTLAPIVLLPGAVRGGGLVVDPPSRE